MKNRRKTAIRAVSNKKVGDSKKEEPDSSKKNSCAVQAPTGDYTAGEGQ
ncbi:TPA: hypothetical protein RG862_000795 [Enterobacter ludwigii]|nr:hypothetical protein [Enterobacter ludwigii]